MFQYDGITADAFWLLAQNRFHNSKAFYEEHKAEIKRLAITPMRQIVVALSDDLQKIDDKIYLNPSYIVSRVRRDTRFTKDKTLYRDHLWITFARYKNVWSNVPCFWFEIEPKSYSYGVGLFDTTPQLMQEYRNALVQNPEEFRKVIKGCVSIGAELITEPYKKEREGNIPEDLRKYYSVKNIGFVCQNQDLSVLQSNQIIKELKSACENYAPLYEFLMGISEKYSSESNVQ